MQGHLFIGRDRNGIDHRPAGASSVLDDPLPVLIDQFPVRFRDPADRGIVCRQDDIVGRVPCPGMFRIDSPDTDFMACQQEYLAVLRTTEQDEGWRRLQQFFGYLAPDGIELFLSSASTGLILIFEKSPRFLTIASIAPGTSEYFHTG